MATKKYEFFMADPGELSIGYSSARRNGGPGIMYSHGSGYQHADVRVLISMIEEAPVFEGRTFPEEIERRGYDVKTLRFSIRRRPDAPIPKE